MRWRIYNRHSRPKVRSGLRLFQERFKIQLLGSCPKSGQSWFFLFHRLSVLLVEYKFFHFVLPTWNLAAEVRCDRTVFQISSCLFNSVLQVERLSIVFCIICISFCALRTSCWRPVSLPCVVRKSFVFARRLGSWQVKLTLWEITSTIVDLTRCSQ